MADHLGFLLWQQALIQQVQRKILPVSEYDLPAICLRSFQYIYQGYNYTRKAKHSCIPAETI